MPSDPRRHRHARFSRARRRARAARDGRGFTLLEVLVAVAVFAVVAALAWGGLASLTRAQQALRAQSAALADLQRALGRLERDLRQTVERPIRDQDGRRRPALLGGPDGLESTRLSLPGGWQTAAPAIERVAWRCRDGRLQRLRWATPDRDPATPVEVEDVLAPIAHCRWRYLGDAGARVDWPDDDGVVLPRAVELRFQRGDEGEYRRVLELPAGRERWR